MRSKKTGLEVFADDHTPRLDISMADAEGAAALAGSDESLLYLVGSHGKCGSWEQFSHLSFPLPKHLPTSIGPQWCGVLVIRVGL